MANIPTKAENPNGLHGRYYLSKIGDNGEKIPTDKGSEYFIMRLDLGGSDINHIKACRIGVNAYADAIEPFIPQLAKDLRERYPLLDSDKNPEECDATKADSSNVADNQEAIEPKGE